MMNSDNENILENKIDLYLNHLISNLAIGNIY